MKRSTHTVNESSDPETGALTYPIYQTSAYRLPKGERFRYSRENNPTVEELSRKIALLDCAPAGNAFSSGMGAITSTFLALLEPGSRVLIQRDIFARSYKFATDFLSKWGVKVEVAGPGTDSLLQGLASKPDLTFVEGISNPVLRVVDINRLAEEARKQGSTLVVDSTFSTPFNETPFKEGADLVIHSASKFLAGHNDVIAGVIAGKDDLVSKIDLIRRTMGASLDPHAAFLVLRGLKTLKVRMDAINRSALNIAKVLEGSAGIARAFYPFLESHPDRDLARKILKGGGGVVTFQINGGRPECLSLLSKLKLVMPANTLGGVNSTISHPWTMSHRGLTDRERNLAGITENMLRLSVGLEDPEDIISDILQAMSTH